VHWGPHHKRCLPDGCSTRRIVSGDLIPFEIGYLDVVRGLSTKSQSKYEKGKLLGVFHLNDFITNIIFYFHYYRTSVTEKKGIIGSKIIHNRFQKNAFEYRVFFLSLCKRFFGIRKRVGSL